MPPTPQFKRLFRQAAFSHAVNGSLFPASITCLTSTKPSRTQTVGFVSADSASYKTKVLCSDNRTDPVLRRPSMIKFRPSFRLRRLLMLLVVFAALIGAFSRSGSFTNTAFSQSYTGPGGYYCPTSWGCGNFGCHARSIVDQTQICDTYPIGGGGGCASPLTCRKTSF
jgi:hypothetical protein